MKIVIKKLVDEAQIPQRASNGAVGYDVYAARVLDKKTKEPIANLPYQLEPGQSVLIGTGVCFVVPWLIQCEVRPRSGLAAKYDVELSNSPGTIDPDFRGEAGILLRNRGQETFMILLGMRIAQLVFTEVKIPVFELVEEIPETLRGIGGFGSTGLTTITEGTEIYEQLIREQDMFYMRMAIAASCRSNCIRGCVRDASGQFPRDNNGLYLNQSHRFGCVIVKDDNVVSYGFNAQAPGQELCSQVGCLRDAEKIPSGTQIERCRAIHAEWMAIQKMLVSGVGSSTKGATIYITTEPCQICAKLIAGCGFKDMVIITGMYSNNGIDIVQKAGINVRYISKESL